jgi:hypothetical protein
LGLLFGLDPIDWTALRRVVSVAASDFENHVTWTNENTTCPWAELLKPAKKAHPQSRSVSRPG